MDVGTPVIFTLVDHFNRVGVVERVVSDDSVIVRSTAFDGSPISLEVEEQHVRLISQVSPLAALGGERGQGSIVLQQVGGGAVRAAKLLGLADAASWTAMIGTYSADGVIAGVRSVIDQRDWSDPLVIADAISRVWLGQRE